MERPMARKITPDEAARFYSRDKTTESVYSINVKNYEEDVFAILKADPDKGLALLIEQYAGYVRAIVLGKLGGFSRQDIEECVSDVFYSVYNSRHTLDSGKGSVKAFVCAVAKRRAIDSLRRLSKTEIVRRGSISVDDYRDATPSSADTLDESTGEDSERLLEAIQSLPEIDRQVVVRRYYFGQSNREIAHALGMKENSVSKRCVRAIAKLKRELSGEVL